jgi:adenylate kinase family enzyme
MNSSKVDIIILRGAPGSGKSQTAKCLSKFFPRGIRMEIDCLRSMVISVDWTNQEEHKNILKISTSLVNDFIKLGFNPIIVVDTFSGDKLTEYLKHLNQIRVNLQIKIFGLYISNDELIRRIESRKKGEFNDIKICHSINEEVKSSKYQGEVQIDTTSSSPILTAAAIHSSLTPK